MRAIFFDRVIKYCEDFPLPERVEGESLISVTYAGICNTDTEIVKGYMGFSGIPGHEFVGVVKESDTKELIGKRVAGEINASCNVCVFCTGGMKTHCPDRTVLGIFKRDGVFAEYTTLPDRTLFCIPDEISDMEAVFIEPLAAAFRIAEQVKLEKGMNAAVLGDGKLALLIAQVLKLAGCGLILSGRHDYKLEIAKNMGIDTVYSGELEKSGKKFDIVIDATGSKQGVSSAIKLLRPKGTLVLKTTVSGETTLDMSSIVINEITVIGSRCGPFEPAIYALKEKMIKVEPLISKVVSMKEAAEILSSGKKEGLFKVLIDICKKT